MKKLLIILVVVMLVGGGCFSKKEPIPEFAGTTYENPQYQFSFEYPVEMEVRVREEQNRAHQYLGLDVDFFASLRDTFSENKPVNVIYLYAIEGLSVEDFKDQLENSGVSEGIKSEETVKVNGIKMTKIINASAAGDDKTHYLFDHNGTTLILSVFLYQEEKFESVLQTFELL
ncbi:hypothetical protein ACFLZY_01045 [Patescibacteria group bacterium]